MNVMLPSWVPANVTLCIAVTCIWRKCSATVGFTCSVITDIQIQTEIEKSDKLKLQLIKTRLTSH